MKKELMDRSERRVMEKFWSMAEGEALSVSDLEQLFQGEKISKVSIFKAVQALSEKEYIRIASLERAGMVYARKFEPAITKEAYAAILLADSGIRSSSLGSLALAMIGNDRDDRPDACKDELLIRDLEQVIAKLRNGEV
ncbi:MAG: hypothetical protein IJ747_03720 [Lachnospiraceae bacterium]|nr:hypothetical protein [Lachnospiraceae bacterium]